MLKAVRGTGGRTHNELINAVMRGDDQTAEELFALFDARPTAINLSYPLNIAQWGGDYSMAERVARGHTRSENADAIRLAGHLNLARLLVGQGEWGAAALELEGAADVDAEQARMARAVLTTLPFLSIPRDDLERAMEELQRWSPPVAEPGSPPERAYDQHARLYLLGLLSSKLGDGARALEYADAIVQLPDEAETAVPGELATTLRADVAWRQGNSPADVLRALEPLRGQLPAVLYNHPVFGQEHARYVRASALQQAGQNDEALRWLEDTFIASPGQVYYLAPTRYLVAQVLDASGRPEEAAEARTTYLELWSDADAGISPPGS
jgi:tetratricopeptide (TPR) repeat protein